MSWEHAQKIKGERGEGSDLSGELKEELCQGSYLKRLKKESKKVEKNNRGVGEVYGKCM